MKIPRDYVERCYAGWIGKVIGVRYGAPIEGWTYDLIRKVYGELNGYVVDYKDFAADDDLNGPLFFVRGLEEDKNLTMSCQNIADAWLNYIPYEHGILWWGGYGNSSEQTAYLNLRSGIPAPQSGSLEQNGPAVAQQIGGQIFSDCWGLIWPGNPDKAADYAEIAAKVSHDGEAVYGSRVLTASIALAFVEKDIRTVLEKALRQIPEKCEYMRMAKAVFAFHDAHPADWRAAMEDIKANWGYNRYPGGCHVIPNSAVMLMSMLYGGGDFSRTMNICAMCGWDTDCTTGNVGTVMGVFCGLSGIDSKWRTPINDFLVSSSTVGQMNIDTLPDYVRRLSSLAYKLAGEEVPERWKSFIGHDRTFDFALPGSTCAFRIAGEGNTKEDAVTHEDEIFRDNRGALRVWFNHMRQGEQRRVYYGTYYHPADFHDSRYDPAFTPVVFPGQTVTMVVRTEEEAEASLYCVDDHQMETLYGAAQKLEKGIWTELTFSLPGGTDARVSQIGLAVKHIGNRQGGMLLYIDSVNIGGKASYTLNFAKETEEQWPGTLHKEITQMTKMKGLWEVWDGKLCGSCADFGEAYSGNPYWKNVQMTFSWQPLVQRGRTGIGFRIQGGIRGYALLCEGDELVLCKKSLGYEKLASCKCPEGEKMVITVRCVEDTFEIISGGNILLACQDSTFERGMFGLIVTDGGRAAYDWVKVEEL